MKRFFLIDLENVGKHALSAKDKEQIRKFDIEDVFIICHNKLNSIMPGELIDALTMAGARFRVIEMASVSKNAMDFCLATQLGYLISQEGKEAEYWIISKDRGFEACVDFGRAIGVKVGITPSFDVCEERKTLQEEQRESLKSLLPGYNKKVISRIFRCLVEAKGLGDYHNRLQKRLCAEQCREIYTKTKHLVACG